MGEIDKIVLMVKEDFVKDGTELIAEFMGWEKIGGLYCKNEKTAGPRHFDFIKNNDWNGLMEVVEKIKTIRDNTDNEVFGRKLLAYSISSINIFDLSVLAPKETVYSRCVFFLRWYKENKPKLVKWDYYLNTLTVWSSFDHGEVLAETEEEAREKATKELRDNLDKANNALKEGFLDFRIAMDFSQLEVKRSK